MDEKPGLEDDVSVASIIYFMLINPSPVASVEDI